MFLLNYFNKNESLKMFSLKVQGLLQRFIQKPYINFHLEYRFKYNMYIVQGLVYIQIEYSLNKYIRKSAKLIEHNNDSKHTKIAYKYLVIC